MKMIAACGLDCSTCPGYVNRNNPDPAVLQKIADEWSERFHRKYVADEIPCSGCQHTGAGRMAPYCHICAIRLCAHGDGYATCAECDKFDGCSTLQDFLAAVPAARTVLTDLRRR